MAGRPRLRRLVQQIEDMEGGEDWLFEQIAEARTIGDIAAELDISRRYLYTWRDRPGHKERLRPKWDAAMRLSAEAMLENATSSFDRLDRVIEHDPITGEDIRRVPAAAEVQLVSGRVKFQQWMAARRDPATFGDQAAGVGAVNVNLSFGDMHIAAMTAVKAREALAPPIEEAEVLEAEVIEAEDEGLGPLL